ncbi:hypothetical protein M413DRAFT_199512 [Hebeloma cylindrosporum]|uniref:Uncharacterized protein n=1 Tax=Hebeloma cylindrosporum TaxID=76867 RepID=A0A0C3CF90_HEBCY|nr:hypothetical protein M413DRAFT_199512 [Hebeloma cylindrosporum h7]
MLTLGFRSLSRPSTGTPFLPWDANFIRLTHRIGANRFLEVTISSVSSTFTTLNIPPLSPAYRFDQTTMLSEKTPRNISRVKLQLWNMSSVTPTSRYHTSIIITPMPKETYIHLTFSCPKLKVIDILLELWSHRFDQDGFLFKRADGGDGKDAWSSSVIQDLGDTEPAISHSNAVNYWLARTNAQLQDICEANFGFIGKFSHYSFFWFMRSLIPALFDPSTDDHGFPLCPGDFHSQNIIITDVDTHPRITGVIDWESSGPTFTTTFAQYPLFIVDHPAWEEEDHPLRERNIRDQTTFDELIREGELIRNPVSGPRLSHLISNGYGIYLFKQMIQSPRIMFSFLYPALFAHVFGEYNEDFSHQYYTALRQKGILKKDTERFNEEHRVWHEAQKVLGEDLVGHDLKLCEFKDLVSKYLDRFDDGGIVREWMLSVN